MSGLKHNETEPFPAQPPDYQLIYPYPQFGSVNIYESRAKSNYNALQARLERRFANGFSGLVSYTWQQTLTDLDSSSVGVAFGAGAGLQTIKTFVRTMARRCSIARSGCRDLDVCTAVLSERHDLLGKTAGGWQIGAIGRSRTGRLSRPPRTASRSPDRTPIYSAIQTCRATNGRSIDGLTSASSPIRRRVSLAMPAKGVIRGSGNNKWDVVISKFLDFASGHRLEFARNCSTLLTNRSSTIRSSHREQPAGRQDHVGQ
jgi:hypothetical protein